MKKLTRERIYEIAGGNRSTYEIARAVEAEVLRLNGVTDKSGASKIVSIEQAKSALDSLDDYARMNVGVDAYGPRGMLERFIDQQSLLRKNADRYLWLRDNNAYFPEENMLRGGEELDQAIDKEMQPRATGCPDTMDDTARFAADELPAILKKQAG